MPKPLSFAGGAFAAMHERLMVTPIEWGALSIAGLDPVFVSKAQAAWQERVQTEYRSAQLINRLLMETLAAGDPFDVHAGIVELLTDELRHVALCAGVVRALGATALLPDTLEIKQPEMFLRMPPSHRALSIAVSMLIVNETLSVGYIRDLAARCDTPVIKDVLAATLADEAEHDAFGAHYVKQSLQRFPIATLPQWRAVAAQAFAAQRSWADRTITELPPDKRTLDAFPDRDLIQLGLFSPQRQALVFEQTYTQTLAPLLKSLDLSSE